MYPEARRSALRWVPKRFCRTAGQLHEGLAVKLPVRAAGVFAQTSQLVLKPGGGTSEVQSHCAEGAWLTDGRREDLGWFEAMMAAGERDTECPSATAAVGIA